MTRFAKGRRATRGFTLVELLVVVMIIAILATVGLPQYFRTVERSREAEATNMCASLNTAAQRYYMSRNVAPSAAADLDVEVKAGNYFDAPAVASSGQTSYEFRLERTGSPGFGITDYAICCGTMDLTTGAGTRPRCGAAGSCTSCPHGFLVP